MVKEDALFEVETDKATMEVPAGVSGYLAATLAQKGDDVPVGQVVAIISAEKPESPVTRALAKAAPAPAPRPAPAAAAAEAPPAKPDAKPTPKHAPQTVAAPASGRVLASPKLRRVALEKGLELGLLVKAGHPQPYHMRDLGVLEDLSAKTPAAVTGAAAQGFRLEAVTAQDGFAPFAASVAETLGEACTAANRIYVHEAVAPEFTRRLTAAMSALRVGDGTDPSVDVGPLVNASTRDKVAEFVADAVAKGATVECGGVVPEGKGYFYPPTVLSNVPETADCVHDEIFGPVAALQTFSDQDDVIRRANDTEYGLVAYVFSGDMKRGLQVCERLDYGMVGLNRGLVSDPAAPFGGTKQSGLGREGGHEGMLEFMETQYISASW